MSDGWDVQDNNPDTIATAQAEEREREIAERVSLWQTQREERERRRLERRAQQGYFVPPFLSEETLRREFVSVAEQFDRRQQVYTNSHGVADPWGANKLYVICNDCGSIGYKLTDDISELQKCTGYNCRSRNVRVVRAGDIALACEETEKGIHMQEVYNARRERIREQRAQRSAERRNG